MAHGSNQEELIRHQRHLQHHEHEAEIFCSIMPILEEQISVLRVMPFALGIT